MTLRTKLALLAILLFALTFAHGEPVSQLKPTGYVNDFAHVLTPAAIAQITNICTQLDQNAQAQVALVTINTLDGADVDSYAVDLYKQWGIGKKGTDRGVLILYAIQDRRARIEVGYGLEPILPDGKVGGFQREAIPQIRANDYSGALLLVTTRVANVIAEDAKITLSNTPQLPAERVQNPPQSLSPRTVLFLIIGFILLMFTPLRNVLFWILLSQLGGGGRGGWGGGGFGGGGGGGGFGGFGGGSSGGGGASSSW